MEMWFSWVSGPKNKETNKKQNKDPEKQEDKEMIKRKNRNRKWSHLPRGYEIRWREVWGSNQNLQLRASNSKLFYSVVSFFIQ